MLTVEQEELVYQQNLKNAYLYQILSCLNMLDDIKNGNFFSNKCEFRKISVASEFIKDCLRKAKAKSLLILVENEEKRLQEFLDIVKENKAVGNQTASVLTDIKKMGSRPL